MSDFGKRLLFAFGLTASADLLLFTAAPGLGLLLFALLTAAVLATIYRQKLTRARGWLALWTVLTVNTVWVHSLIGTLMLIALTWVVLALALMREAPQFFTGFLRGMTGGARSFTLLGSDLRRWVLISNRNLLTRASNRPGLLRRLPPFWVYVLPAGLILVFALLVIPANLVLGRWVEQALTWVWNQFTALFDFEFGRLFFWFAMSLGIYGLIRFRLGRHPAHRPRTEPKHSPDWLVPPRTNAIGANQPRDNSTHERQACLLTFAGLNVLYLAANLADLFFIWLQVHLPDGMTYAEFAHHGSYRLIVAVVLAAGLVPAFFRRAALASSDRRTRLLGYAFVVQNLVVLLGAARRLMIYDEVYGLSRFRVATYLWLALVFVGFVLILVKIRRNKPFRFLLETNAISSALLLTLVGWLNLDGFIADWNVARYEAGQTKLMDIQYLGELDAGALPALERLTTSADPDVASKARLVLNRRRQEEKALLADWRNWTWQAAKAQQATSGN